MYLLCKLIGMSLPKIGQELGGCGPRHADLLKAEGHRANGALS